MEVKVDPSTPLLWVLREELKMTGTKYGCGISVCGSLFQIAVNEGRTSMSGIEGNVVAITGASSGIGEATALLLAERKM